MDKIKEDTPQVIEGNKIIAEFMGYEYHSDRNIFIYTKDDLQFNGHSKEWPIYGLAYDTSWDWLMPVVEKIKGSGYFYKLTEWQFFICKYSDYSGVIAYDSKTDIYEPEIERVVKTVVRFIQFYNQNKTL